MIFVAQMAELVDAQVSGTCAARRGGSNPLLGTILSLKIEYNQNTINKSTIDIIS